MSLQSNAVDDYINAIQSVIHVENTTLDIDALVDHALEEARERAREMDNPETQMDIGSSNNHVGESSRTALAMVASTVMVEDTKRVPSIEPVTKNISLEDDTTYQCNLCFESTTNYSYFQIHLQVIHNKDQHCDMIKHPEMAPSLEEFNTYCHPCEQECISVMNYQRHLQSMHHLLPRYPHIRGLGGGSDSINLDHYCAVCKVYFRALGEYKDHLQSQHHLDQLSAAAPVNYCSSCNITYLTQELYERHLYYKHQVHQTGADPNKLPTIVLPFNYCYHCDKQHQSNAKYVRHLKRKHKETLLQHKRLPKLSDFGYECLICKNKFTTRSLLQGHLKEAHVVRHGNVSKEKEDDFSGSTPTRPPADVMRNLSRMPPDIDDYDYCRSCQTKFLSNWNYRIHLRLVHYIYVEEKPRKKAGGNSDDSLLPDPYNSDWYCRICKKHKKSSRSYRKHCKRVHHMKIKRREARRA